MYVLAVSCHRGGTPIPRSDMSRIYAEMFLLDQRMGTNWDLRRQADTMLVYEAVLARYGYTVDDYRASQEEYIKDPRRYTKMLKKSVGILTNEKKALTKEKDRMDAILEARRGTSRFSPNRILLLDTLFFLDSISSFDFQKGLDTAYCGPQMIVWRDTVNVGIKNVKTENVEIQ